MTRANLTAVIASVAQGGKRADAHAQAICGKPTGKSAAFVQRSYVRVVPLVLIAFAASVQAVEIPESCRVRNRGGRCILAGVATLGRLHKIPALESLAPNGVIQGDEGPSDNRVRQILHARGVSWRGHDHGSFNRELLPLANTHGCVVGMRAGTPWLGGRSLTWSHSIVLTGYDDEEVWFYCSDNPERLWRKTREWFDRGWTGSSMVFGAQP